MLTREKLARLVVRTRTAQKAYSAAKRKDSQVAREVLEASGQMERELDRAADEILSDDLLPLRE